MDPSQLLPTTEIQQERSKHNPDNGQATQATATGKAQLRDLSLSSNDGNSDCAHTCFIFLSSNEHEDRDEQQQHYSE